MGQMRQPMIAKSALADYLAQPRDDWRQLKKLHQSELRLAVRKGWQFRPLTTPRFHQWVGLYAGLRCQEYLFFYDPGVGKSKIALDIISARKGLGQIRKALVIVENEVNVYNWGTQVKTHSDLRASLLLGTIKQRRAQLVTDTEAEVYVLSYAGLQHLFCTLTKVVGKNGKVKNRMVPDLADVKRLARQFQLVVFDEIQNCKNHQSLTYKLCKAISSVIPYRYGLTGTPTGVDPIDFWAEFKLIDRGATLGNTISLYRAAFFTAKQNYWSGWPEYHFDRRKKKLLTKVRQHRSLAYADSEINDLPELVEIEVSIPLAAEASAYYKQIRDTVRTAALLLGKAEGGLLKFKNSFMKLRQLASSFLKTDYGILEFPNSKIEWVVGQLPTLVKDDKVVIFYEFIASGKALEKALRGKVRFVKIDGSVKNKVPALTKFLEDPKIRVLLANLESGAVGLNLQVANHAIFYELPTSLITYKQAIKRIHRTGQTKRSYLYFLLSTDTIEPKQLQHLQSNRELLDAVLNGTSKL